MAAVETVLSKLVQFEFVEPEYETITETVCTYVPPPPPSPDPPEEGGSPPVTGPYPCYKLVEVWVENPDGSGYWGQVLIPCGVELGDS